MAKSISAPFIECSAADGVNVDIAFRELVKLIRKDERVSTLNVESGRQPADLMAAKCPRLRASFSHLAKPDEPLRQSGAVRAETERPRVWSSDVQSAQASSAASRFQCPRQRRRMLCLDVAKRHLKGTRKGAERKVCISGTFGQEAPVLAQDRDGHERRIQSPSIRNMYKYDYEPPLRSHPGNDDAPALLPLWLAEERVHLHAFREQFLHPVRDGCCSFVHRDAQAPRSSVAIRIRDFGSAGPRSGTVLENFRARLTRRSGEACRP